MMPSRWPREPEAEDFGPLFSGAEPEERYPEAFGAETVAVKISAGPPAPELPPPIYEAPAEEPPPAPSIEAQDHETLALFGHDLFGAPAAAPGATGALAARFIVPPFSVLDARQGAWQERKRAWLGLGIRSEIGRGASLMGMSDAVSLRLREGEAAYRARLDPERGLLDRSKQTNDIGYYGKKRLAEGEAAQRARLTGEGAA